MYVYSNYFPARPYSRGSYPRVIRPPVLARPRGLGAPTSASIGAGITSGVTYGATTALSTGSKVAGGITGGLMAVAPFTGPAAPFVAGLALLVAPIASLFKGCGSTCTISSQYADQMTATIQQLRSYYLQQPVRTVSMQQATLAQMQQLVSWLQQKCSDPSLGAAGQRCISERLVRGGTAPWCPNPGHVGCDYYTVYIDPIANDPNVVPDHPVAAPASSSSSSAAAVSSLFSSIPLWALGAAALGGAWLLTRTG